MDSIFTEIIKAIKEVGFPIVVTMYVLLRLDKSLREMTKALEALARLTYGVSYKKALVPPGADEEK